MNIALSKTATYLLLDLKIGLSSDPEAACAFQEKKKWSRETVLKEISIPREFEKDQEKKLHLANAKP